MVRVPLLAPTRPDILALLEHHAQAMAAYLLVRPILLLLHIIYGKLHPVLLEKPAATVLASPLPPRAPVIPAIRVQTVQIVNLAQ